MFDIKILTECLIVEMDEDMLLGNDLLSLLGIDVVELFMSCLEKDSQQKILTK